MIKTSMIINPNNIYEINILHSFTALKKGQMIKLMQYIYDNDMEKIEYLINSYLKYKLIDSGKDKNGEGYYCIYGTKDFFKSIEVGKLIPGLSFDMFLSDMKYQIDKDGQSNEVMTSYLRSKGNWVKYLSTLSNKPHDYLRDIEEYNRGDKPPYLDAIRAKGVDIVTIIGGKLIAYKDIYMDISQKAITGLFITLSFYFEFDNIVLCINGNLTEKMVESFNAAHDKIKSTQPLKIKAFEDIYIAFVVEDGEIRKMKMKDFLEGIHA